MSETTVAAAEKRTLMRAAIVIAVACILGLVVLPALGKGLFSGEADRRPAPAFNLPVVYQGEDGARLNLADMKGSPVLIDFYATWCGPCSMQTPIVDRVARQHQKSGLKVVAINVYDDDHNAAARFAKGKDLSYPILVDESGLVQREYGVTRLPTLVIIDKEGRIAHVSSGVMDEASLDKLVREVL